MAEYRAALAATFAWIALWPTAFLLVAWSLVVAVAVRWAPARLRGPLDLEAHFAGPDLGTRKQAWIRLADLFFVDTEWDDNVWTSTAQWLRANAFDRGAVRAILVHEVAPVAGANFAYLLYPIIPSVWSGFADSIADEIAAHVASPSRRVSDALRLGPVMREAFYGRIVDLLEWRRLERLLGEKEN